MPTFSYSQSGYNCGTAASEQSSSVATELQTILEELRNQY